MYLRRDDADLLVTAFGPGPRTLVAHGGWVGSGELWLPPFELLSRTWRTVTYDHRGTGATVTRAPAITFDALVDDLFAVLDALEIERCVLAGESSGAAVVLEAALRQPGRFEGLVIVAGRQDGALSPRVQAMIRGCQTDFAGTMAAFVDACIPEQDSAAERMWGLRIVIRQPADTADMVTRLPRAHLVVADDAGHVPTITRPQWVAAQIESFFGGAIQSGLWGQQNLHEALAIEPR